MVPRIASYRGSQSTGFLLVGLFCLFLGNPLPGQTSEELRARFLNEAPAAWEEYAAFAEGLQGTVRGELTSEGKSFTNSVVTFNSSPSCKMVLFQGLSSGDTVGRLHVFNPVYGFTLKRKDKDAEWVLENLTVGERRTEQIDWAKRSGFRRACVRLGGDDLAALIRQPNFRVLRASSVQRDGRELIQVDFANPHPDPEDRHPFYPIQGGSLLLDPNKFWTLHSCTLRNTYATGDATATMT